MSDQANCLKRIQELFTHGKEPFYMLYRGIPVSIEMVDALQEELHIQLTYKHRTIIGCISPAAVQQQLMLYIQFLYRQMFYFQGVPYFATLVAPSNTEQKVTLGIGPMAESKTISRYQNIPKCLAELKNIREEKKQNM